MRRVIVWAAVAALLLAGLPTGGTAARIATRALPVPGLTGEWVVLYAAGVPNDVARAAIGAAGGTIVRENAAIGTATVRTTLDPARFLHAIGRQRTLAGATPNAAIGHTPPTRPATLDVRGAASAAKEIEPSAGSGGGDGDGGPRPGADPLTPLQWDMKLIGATADAAHAIQGGDRRVLVGVIDTGVDGNHPDIKPNFSFELSRNFTTDIPEVDGPCEVPSCIDPPDTDDDGHGTHVAGTIAAPLNGIGITGVAPNVTIVNIRAGQDSGLFFLQSVVDALTYAGDIGVNVVNMSFYIDPWLYNCPNNPADSPEAQMAQRTTIAATQRALDYARARGVTLIVAAGNGHSDLDRPATDDSSPNFPKGTAYTRAVDRTCLIMPTDGRGVLNVTAVGPSGRKAYYSDYGADHAAVAAPGGDILDYYGTSQYQPVTNGILAPYPRAVLLANGEIDAAGKPTPQGRLVVRDCRGDVCAYYRYLQGTSMAAPHATGVVALIVSQYGRPSRLHPDGLALSPARAERILLASAAPRACPLQNPVTYPGIRPEIATAYAARCEGDPGRNSFYGAGIVDAGRAVTDPAPRTPGGP